MDRVRSQQDDTVDLLCYRHYGDSSMVTEIFEANPGLVEKGLFLPHGTDVWLPPRKVKPRRSVVLWD